MMILKAIMAGVYVGLDHGIWIGLLLRKVKKPSRKEVIFPISIWITLLQIVICFFIQYVQDNIMIQIGASMILIWTALQLFQEMPDTRGSRFKEVIRIVFLILSGSMDNLFTIQASSGNSNALMILSASLSFPLILFTVRYFIPLVEGKLWFFLYGILLLAYSSAHILLDTMNIQNTLLEVLIMALLVVIIFIFGPILASIRSAKK
jgi:Integral membrane protein TerC family